MAAPYSLRNAGLNWELLDANGNCIQSFSDFHLAQASFVAALTQALQGCSQISYPPNIGGGSFLR